MKYFIDYEKSTGKILGFIIDETKKEGVIIEVSKEQWDTAMTFNKIIIDGENISFDKVDWRTQEEIKREEINTQIAEAKTYLSSTDFYMTVDKYSELDEVRKVELTTKRAEARKLINTLKIELEGL